MKELRTRWWISCWPGAVFESGGLIDELKKRLAERMLNAEMDHHLDSGAGQDTGNHRNGYGSKTVITDTGKLEPAIPHDRHGRFDPVLIGAARKPGWADQQRMADRNEHHDGGTLRHQLAAAAKLHFAFTALVELFHSMSNPPTRNRQTRQQLAQLYTDIQGLRYTSGRILMDSDKPAMKGAAASLIKIMWSELDQRMHDFALAVQGPASQLTRGSAHAVRDGRWQFEFLRSRANTIEMGTSEIHRNTIAERGLGLPRSR